jgi:hypothetical protein
MGRGFPRRDRPHPALATGEGRRSLGRPVAAGRSRKARSANAGSGEEARRAGDSRASGSWPGDRPSRGFAESGVVPDRIHRSVPVPQCVPARVVPRAARVTVPRWPCGRYAGAGGWPRAVAEESERAASFGTR